MTDTPRSGSSSGRPHDPTSFGNGRYVVQQRLGAGNFATVYLAFDERLDVAVAVKLLADHWSWDPEIRGRFVQEARMLRALNDPRVVQIRDIAETDDGRPYLVMDYATEGTLEQRLIDLAHRGDRPSATELQEFVAEVAAAVGVLHARRIAHRDIKPSNMLITRDPGVTATGRRGDGLLRPGERLMLGDLGLAKDLRADSGVTVGVGTAGYMAPEQAGPGARIDTRSDLYALSALMSQVATGEIPDPLRRYSDGTVSSGRPLPASISGAFRRALEHGLDQDPDKRPQTIDAWQRAVVDGLAELGAPEVAAVTLAPMAPPPSIDTTMRIPTPNVPPPVSLPGAPVSSPGSSPVPSPGAPVSSPGSLPPPPPPSGQVPVVDTSGTTGATPSRRTVQLIAAAIAVVALVVIGIVVATRGGDDADAAPDTTEPTDTTVEVATTTADTSTTAAVSTTAAPTTAAPTTAAPTTAAPVPTTVAPTAPPETAPPAPTPFVQITGPTEVPADTMSRYWEVAFAGVVGGTWQLSGPNGIIPLNDARWTPGDGFQAGMPAGTYTLLLTAFDAAGNVYSAQHVFTAL
ncbi:MAG: serine/threonine protein kinase [Acidimicrobiales bacterium]|nr:serine/threonine protein kinase [Acidimicrobiales bacterium]MCB9392174.1 serine/threonine protein kinase [Acidimicrobiaceae bacterium]